MYLHPSIARPADNCLLLHSRLCTARPDIEKLMEYISKKFAGKKYIRLRSLVSWSSINPRRHCIV